ncbi:MAG: histidine--tRNA ligase [Candidatus Auribacterota bacterium]
MTITALRGTYDILPPQSYIWEKAESQARKMFALYGYSELRTPIIEQTQLFSRSIGENTDIVSKEMYTFADRKGRSITMRPEATAPVVRAYIEHKLYKDQSLCKFYYIGPMFRYERPQAGRNRQFYQLGTEILGTEHPYHDAESISLAVSYFKSLGIDNIVVKINSVGDAESKQKYSSILKNFFAGSLDTMCPDCNTRFEKNTLRMLDCKVPACKEIIKNAPPLNENLNDASKTHFESVLALLNKMKIAYEIEPRLVRGLDYYTNTIFEITHSHLGSQDALGGGGRYNNLIAEMGGPQTGAVGFAVGIDRLVIVLEKMMANNSTITAGSDLDLYILNLDNALFTDHAELLHSLRQHDIRADICTEQKSFKAQMRSANKANARFVLIQGQNERDNNIFKLKDMINGTEEDIKTINNNVDIDKLVERIRQS